MNDTDLKELLVLAGLTYRGFAALPKPLHDGAVEGALLDGLSKLPQVSGKWNLVWGPVARRAGDPFDSSAMYVVRNATNPNRVVVAVRGTNPVSLTDWLQGDLTVGTLVRWPFTQDGAAISTSTAIGLRALISMDAPLSSVGGAGAFAEKLLAPLAAEIAAALEKVATLLDDELAAKLDGWLAKWAADAGLPRKVGKWLTATSPFSPSDIASARRAKDAGRRTLFQFLSDESASRGALDVTVTGHSKGGALAPTLALWLKETQDAREGFRGWDNEGKSSIGCVSFAAPTPGNAAFAARIDTQLVDFRRVANSNDIVTHAWEEEQLRSIAELYQGRAAGLRPLFDIVANDVAALDYRHPKSGAIAFAGAATPKPSFVGEVVHQHLTAYLDHFRLSEEGIDVHKLFFG